MVDHIVTLFFYKRSWLLLIEFGNKVLDIG